MKPLFRHLALALAAAAAITACKKNEMEVAREAEQALPAEEQVAPGDVDEKRSAADAADRELLSQPMPAERVVPGDATAPAAAGLQTGGAEFEAWFKKNGLDLSDPAMLDADADGDGASNRDEFLADTDPRDPNARPGVHKTIRLKEYSEVRLPVMVESVEGDKARLRRTDGEGKVETVKAGETVPGLPLKVERVSQIRDVDKGGNPVDRSTVIVEDPATKERLTLVKDMPARTSASSAVLTSPDGLSTVKVKQDDVFKWPGDDTASYKVIDLREDQVVLQQVENKKMWTVTRTPR